MDLPLSDNSAGPINPCGGHAGSTRRGGAQLGWRGVGLGGLASRNSTSMWRNKSVRHVRVVRVARIPVRVVSLEGRFLSGVNRTRARLRMSHQTDVLVLYRYSPTFQASTGAWARRNTKRPKCFMSCAFVLCGCVCQVEARRISFP